MMIKRLAKLFKAINLLKIPIAIITAIALGVPTSADAIEAIENFNTNISISPEGTLNIEETITVRHEGTLIRRGIYRDLSTAKGENYNIISVTRNNKDEPWFIEKKQDKIRLNMGDDTLLPAPGVSIYKIKYEMTGALRYLRKKKANELYLNLTGTWNFPILKGAATVHLPEGTKLLSQYSYTTGTSIKLPPTGVFYFDRLSRGDEVTIALAFSPDTVKIPVTRQHALLVLGLVLGLAYYVIAWIFLGRDPKGTPAMPRWDTPPDLTPLECAFIENQGAIPQNSLLINLITLHQQKIINLTRKRKSGIFDTTRYTIMPVKSTRPPENAEQKQALKFFRQPIELNGTTNKSLIEYKTALIKNTRHRLEAKFYRRRYLWVCLGAVIFLLFSLFADSETTFLWLYIMSIILPLMQLFRWLIFILPAAFITLYISTGDQNETTAYLLITSIIIFIFRYLLFQPTLTGRRIMTHLEGLRMFLSAITDNNIPVNEDNRLTPQEMDELFPYAVALGLEKKWEQKYKTLFGNDILEKSQLTHTHISTSDLTSLCAAGTTATVHHSGGSFGGGFAGGGFGGGGGGGR